MMKGHFAFSILIVGILVFLRVPCRSQEKTGPQANDSIKSFTISNKESFVQGINKVRKGHVSFMDGSRVHFRNMTILKDSLSFEDYMKSRKSFQSDEILEISKESSSAPLGLLLGGSAGLVLGLVAANSLDDMADFVVLFSTFGMEENVDTRSDQAKLVISSTLMGAGIGALIGLPFRKNRIIYVNKGKTGFQPEIMVFPTCGKGMMINCNIAIRFKD